MTLTATPHAEALAGLAALRDFLAAHPDIPLAAAPNPFEVYALGGTDWQQREEVDRIAAVLGVAARENEDGSHYTAERDFGGGVTYRATAVCRAALDRYRRHMAPYHAETRRRMSAARGNAVAA